MNEYKNREILTIAVANSNTIADVCRYFGLSPKGSNYNSIKTAINSFGIDTSHFKRQSNKGIKHRDLSEILINGLPCNATKLKKRLIREGVKKYQCEKCGLSEWNNEPITLELHHINGNHNDNHLENLQILCPNCHSQTVSFVGKNKNIVDDNAIAELLKREERCKEEILSNKYYWGELRKTDSKPLKKCMMCGKEYKGRGEKYCSKECANKSAQKMNITKEQLLTAATTTSSLIQLGKLFNMTDNGIRKWLVRYDILDEVKKILKKQ